MNILIAIVVALLISNSIKFLVFLWHGGVASRGSLFWHYLWTGKFPSSHSAAFGAMTTGFWYTEGLTPLVTFSVVMTFFVLYTLLENKKRYELLEEYYLQSTDKAIQLLVSEKKISDFEGHTVIEVFAGLLLGIVTAFVLMQVLV